MLLGEILQVAFQSIRANKLRSMLTMLGIIIGVGAVITMVALGTGAHLLTLRFSRADETEADLIGMDIAARAGFDPRAAITLWQKMGKLGGNAPPEWLSTHPSHETRLRDLETYAQKVMPLYQAASR